VPPFGRSPPRLSRPAVETIERPLLRSHACERLEGPRAAACKPSNTSLSSVPIGRRRHISGGNRADPAQPWLPGFRMSAPITATAPRLWMTNVHGVSRSRCVGQSAMFAGIVFHVQPSRVVGPAVARLVMAMTPRPPV